MEIVKLIGVLIVIAGFILKLDTLAMVVTAGLATVREVRNWYGLQSQ